MTLVLSTDEYDRSPPPFKYENECFSCAQSDVCKVLFDFQFLILECANK